MDPYWKHFLHWFPWFLQLHNHHQLHDSSSERRTVLEHLSHLMEGKISVSQRPLMVNPSPPNRIPLRNKGFVSSKTAGVADLVILHHSEMFDLFVTPMQTQTNEVGFEPREIKKQLPLGCLLFVCLRCWGYLGVVWVATCTVRHIP